MSFCKHYIIGASVGQGAEPTAITVAEQESHSTETGWKREVVELRLRHLARLNQDAGFPGLVEEVHGIKKRLLEDDQSGDGPSVVIDITHSGEAIIDLFKTYDIDPTPVIITQSGGAHRMEGSTIWRLGKVDMVGGMRLAMQTDKLKTSKKHELTQTLVEQLRAFKMRASSASPSDMQAWRENEFDDLVYAAGVTVWWGNEHIPISPGAQAARRRKIEEHRKLIARMIV